MEDGGPEEAKEMRKKAETEMWESGNVKHRWQPVLKRAKQDRRHAQTKEARKRIARSYSMVVHMKRAQDKEIFNDVDATIRLKKNTETLHKRI